MVVEEEYMTGTKSREVAPVQKSPPERLLSLTPSNQTYAEMDIDTYVYPADDDDVYPDAPKQQAPKPPS